MDLERIKQNFRIRSGRARKSKKHAKTQGVPVPPKETVQQSTNLPNGTSSPASPELTVKRKNEKEADPRVEEDKEIHIQKDRRDQDNNTLQAEATLPSDEAPDPATPVKQEDKPVNSVDEESDLRSSPQQNIASSSSTVRSRTESLGSEDSNLDLQAPKKSPTMADPQASTHPTSSDAEDFDLAPPKPRSKPPSIETLAELLFSSGHLDTLLHYPAQLSRFSTFLQKYLPNIYPQLAQYLETRKAIKAVEYANAVAEGLRPKSDGAQSSENVLSKAAKIDPDFEAICTSSFEELIDNALPSFVSYSLVRIVSECLTNEITGRSTPIMRDLVDGLSEVFCLTDPNQEDNPIIYASEEFYRLTRYGPEDVINNNCRFLQGRKTNPASPRRLKHAIQSGEEISETLLNYRRDGRPFINLLMVAPLHDKNGKLKYHIGAQVDVSGLVAGGRALDSFQRYLNRRSEDQRRDTVEKDDKNLDDDQRRKKRALAKLRDLSETFDLEETAVVQATSRSNSITRDEDEVGSTTSLDRLKAHRRVYVNSESSEYGDEDAVEEQKDAADWTLGESGDGRLSGKLPGVYDSFILFRPGPSFRIVFVSPKLRKIGDVLQTPFLSHVAAPSGTLSGLAESLKIGVPVSAKVHFTPERGEKRGGTTLRSGTKHEDGKNGRAVWVSCTPLLGEDERIGVWMCVVVEKSKVGSIRRRRPVGLEEKERTEVSSPSRKQTSNIESEGNNSKREDAPIKPVRVDSETAIKSKVDEHEESADAGQEQSSKTVRPQESMYFDAEQGGEIDKEEVSDPAETRQSTKTEEVTVNGDDASHLSIQERDPRAVVTPVEEYEEPEANSRSYSVELPGINISAANHDDTNDEYITTRSPVTPSRQVNGRVLIEEDSDVLQDSDLDHQRENLNIGRKRRGSGSPRSLNSPASDIPPSIPSSAHLADEEDDDYSLDIDTPTRVRHQRSPSPPDAENEESSRHLEQSQATIKPERRGSADQGSDRDSAISLDSPAQIRNRSRSSRGETRPKQTEPDQDGSDYENEGSDKEETEAEKHEKDVEAWVKEGRPPTSRHNSDKQTAEHDHSHDGTGRPNHPTMTMDYLRAGSNRWQRPTRRRLDTDFEKDNTDGVDVESMSFDICATSPYSVD